MSRAFLLFDAAHERQIHEPPFLFSFFVWFLNEKGIGGRTAYNQPSGRESVHLLVREERWTDRHNGRILFPFPHAIVGAGKG